jgi:hypothetical protein
MSSRRAALQELDRELKMRERKYPEWIAERPKSAPRFRRQYAALRDVRDAIAVLNDTEYRRLLKEGKAKRKAGSTGTQTTLL